MLDDKYTWDKHSIYVVQPYSAQALAIAEMLYLDGLDRKVIAILNLNEKINKSKVKYYSGVVRIKQISELPDYIQIVPGGANSTELLLKNFGSISLNKVRMDSGALKVYDKKWFIKHCEERGFPVPVTYQQLSDLTEKAFPVFYKQKQEQGGGVRGLAYSMNEIPKEHVNDLIFQEYIEDPGTYGVGFIADSGVMIANFSHYEKESYPKTGGSAVVIERIENARIIELTRDMLGTLNYSGWGLAEFKYCSKRQDFVFMEINAKFWASCDFAFKNNALFMDMLFGVKREFVPVAGVYYLNRALTRGPLFLFQSFAYMWKYQVRRYPGLFQSFISGVLPAKVKKGIKGSKS